MRPVPDSSRGFTLVELIITVLILAIATGAMVSAMSFALRHQADDMPRAKMIALAQAYFDEIAAKRYDENTPVGGLPACHPSTVACSPAAGFSDGETRAQFDDVDDFDGLDDQPPRRADGTILNDYASYRVQVSVRYPNASQATQLGIASATDAKLIDIRVSSADGSDYSFSVLRTNF